MKALWIATTVLVASLSGPAHAQNGIPFGQASANAKLEALRLHWSKKPTRSDKKDSTTHKFMALSPTGVQTACPYALTSQPPTTQDIRAYTENTFGANLNVLGSFGDTGAKGIPSAQNSIRPEALGQIEFESEHFGFDWTKCGNLPIYHGPTFSFGGTVGLVPALVLENLSTTSTTNPLANPKNRPMFQDAFGWSLVGKMNIATSHLSQLDLFATLGEKYLLSQVTSFKQGDDTITAIPVSDKEGQSSVYWETGIQWKYLNTDIINAYSNKTDVLNPPFDISIGYKRDKRFNGSGDLSSFLHPDRFVFLRFTVGLNKIGNWTGDQVLPGKGYTFKFGIDYERPIGDGNMPTSTRYYVSANLVIVNLFKPPAPSPVARPTVTSISPTTATAAATITVTVTGKDFGQGEPTSTVTFGTKTAPLKSWGQTLILVDMPSGLVAGTPVPVVVTVGGLQSNNDVQFTPTN